MRRILLLASFIAAFPAASVRAAEPPVVLKAARLFDATSERVTSPGVVLVRDGKIAAVGSHVETPAGAQVIELGDATLLPGFMDVHTHLSSQMSKDWNKDEVDSLRRTVAERSIRASAFAERTLMAGFTTVRNVGAGDSVDVGLRNAINDDVVPGPRMIVSGNALGSRGGHCDSGGYPHMLFGRESGLQDGIAAGADNFRDAVRFAVKYGADVIKVCATGGVLSLADSVDSPQLTQDEMNALIDEAHRLDRRVAAHAHGDQGAMVAVTAGVDSIEHGTFLSKKTLKEMKKRGTFLVPTLMAYEGVDPKRNDFPPEIAKKAAAAIRGRAESMKLAHQIGVRMALGTDAGVIPHGTNAHEFALMVHYGATSAEALLAGTREAADLIGVLPDSGTLEPGKRADIVAVPGNPLDKIEQTEKVFFVMKKGKIYRQDENPGAVTSGTR